MPSSQLRAKTRETRKTWASTLAAKSVTQSTGPRGTGRYKSTRSDRRGQQELLQEQLEEGLELYSHINPAGPCIASGSKFLAPASSPPSELDTRPQTAIARPGKRLAKPSVAYTASIDEADDLLACLGPGPLGLDLEWNFSYKTGSRRTALAQICSSTLILILHISAMGKLPQGLIRILENPTIIKTGVAIRNDAQKLQRDFGVRSRNIVELSKLASAAQPSRWAHRRHLISLRDLTRVYLGQRLDKGAVRTSDWETATLTPTQIEYAANDTFVGLEILREICTYFPSSSASPATSVLNQVDNLLASQSTPPAQSPLPDMETALRQVSQDLHAEFHDLLRANEVKAALCKAQAQTRTESSTGTDIAGIGTRREGIREALQTINTPQAHIPDTTPTPHRTLDNAEITDTGSDSDGDAVVITSVLLAHDRAMHKWLYGKMSLQEVANASNIKFGTAASYILKSLADASMLRLKELKERKTRPKSLLDDFSTEDKTRLYSEFQQSEAVNHHTRRLYHNITAGIGWKQIESHSFESKG